MIIHWNHDMNHRSIILFLCLLFIFNSNSIAGEREKLTKQMVLIGNTESDSIQLVMIRKLINDPELLLSEQEDAKILSKEIYNWINNPRIDYFDGAVRKLRYYPIDIATDSPFYPLALYYQTRMLVWVAFEHGYIWSVPAKREEVIGEVKKNFESLHKIFPENKIISMYLGEIYPTKHPIDYDDKAPAWANDQREAIERLAEIIHWWIDNRHQEKGDYGGGWGDDCEMWRFWQPILIGFRDPKVEAAQERFSLALMAQPHMVKGYTNRISDVEHTAEDGADAITPMMLLQPNNLEWTNKALQLYSMMDTLWTGTNDRGQLQFKSTYFTSDSVDITDRKACGTVYHPRAVQPLLLYWQRTGDQKVGELLLRWLSTWVDATAREERGKPAGVIPSAIHWPDGNVGGVSSNWWEPNNYVNNTLYRWPSAMTMMTQSLVLAFHMSQDSAFIEPIRSMANIRQYFLDQKISEPTIPGSKLWCGQQLGSISDVLCKYKILTGDDEFDPLIKSNSSPYMRFRFYQDDSALFAKFKQTAKALRDNFPGYTQEVRFTDRVLRFPYLFSTPGLFSNLTEPIFIPDTKTLLSSITGEPGDGLYFPMHAVRWLTKPEKIGALVHKSSPEIFRAELYHFGEHERSFDAELYLLNEGEYEGRLIDVESGDVLMKTIFMVTDSATRINIKLPPQQLCEFSVERK